MDICKWQAWVYELELTNFLHQELFFSNLTNINSTEFFCVSITCFIVSYLLFISALHFFHRVVRKSVNFISNVLQTNTREKQTKEKQKLSLWYSHYWPYITSLSFRWLGASNHSLRVLWKSLPFSFCQLAQTGKVGHLIRVIHLSLGVGYNTVSHTGTFYSYLVFYW